MASQYLKQSEEIDESDYLDETDYAILDFIKNMEKKQFDEVPEPTPYQISTHSTTCYIGSEIEPECEQALDFTFIVDYFPKYILEKMIFEEGAPFCPFHGFKMDRMEIRFDTMYTLGRKPPLVKINGTNMWDPHAPEQSKAAIYQYFKTNTIQYERKNGRPKREAEAAVPGMKMACPKGAGVASAGSGASLREIQVITQEDLHAHAEETRSVTSEDLRIKEYEHMYNSCSIIVQSTPTSKPVNIILWSNGSMTITGCLYRMDGYEAGRTLLEHLKTFPRVFQGIKKLDMEAKTKSAKKKNKILYPLPSPEYVESLGIQGYNVTMINSKYSLGFNMDLTAFYEILKEEVPELFVMYDTEDYRGLQISYFWNRTRETPEEQTGICNCKLPCSAKKISKKCFSPFAIKQVNNPNICKKVTISIFKSGKIIITGANREEQIQCAYDYLNSLVRRFYTAIVKISIEEIVQREATEKKKVQEATTPASTTTYSILQECDKRFGIEEVPKKTPSKKAPSGKKKVATATVPAQKEGSIEVEVLKKVHIVSKSSKLKGKPVAEVA